MRPGREAGREGALHFSDWLPPLPRCEVFRLLAAPELRHEWMLQRRDRVSTASFRRLVLGADLIPLALWKREYTFFVPFRVCTWIMVRWVSGARRNCWDWPSALPACERRNQRLFSLIFRGEIPKSLSLDYGLLRWVVRVYSRTVFWLLNVILQTRRVQNARRWWKSALYFQPNVNLNELMLCDSIPKWSVNINIALWFCCVPLAPFPQY